MDEMEDTEELMRNISPNTRKNEMEDTEELMRNISHNTRKRVLDIWDRVEADFARKEAEDEKRRAQEYLALVQANEQAEKKQKSDAAARRRALKGKPAPKAGNTVKYIGKSDSSEAHLTHGKQYTVTHFSQSQGHGRAYWIRDDVGRPIGLPREQLEVIPK